MSFPRVQRLVGSGDPMRKFNIVVLGDGFQEPELSTFDEYADLIAVRLLNMQPFRSVADRINVWRVSTVSVDSGVSFPGKPKDTHYGVEGNFRGEDFPGYLGTRHQHRVIAAAALAAPVGAPCVRIVVANYDADGGRGSHADRTVFMPLYKVDQNGPVPAVRRKRDFVQITAHECGHAIANLAEEYIGCNPHTVGERHKNQQTPEETALNPVPKWRALAYPRELDSEGRFKAIHKVRDRMTRGIGEPRAPIVAPAFTGMLGLYWGCMDIDRKLKPRRPAAKGCSQVDRRGAPFQRPMARCRMRYWEHEFCRVCANELKTIILQCTH